MANIVSQKRMAAEIMKCGRSRVRITPGKEVEEALTREDVRNLIRKGLIRKVQKKGSSRAASRRIMVQKSKGRRMGRGSRKGKLSARMPAKKRWARTVKTLRSLLAELRDSGRIERSDYRKLYLKVKGGMFRNRKHIMLYMKEHELLKEASGTLKKSRTRASKAAPREGTAKGAEATRKPSSKKKASAEMAASGKAGQTRRAAKKRGK
jgi:large subunit ribosomal protein L19e